MELYPFLYCGRVDSVRPLVFAVALAHNHHLALLRLSRGLHHGFNLTALVIVLGLFFALFDALGRHGLVTMTCRGFPLSDGCFNGVQ